MITSQIYILVSIIILLVVFILTFFVRKNTNKKSITPLAGVAFAFIIAGIVFGNNRLIGYSLMGIGVLLAIIDIIRKAKK